MSSSAKAPSEVDVVLFPHALGVGLCWKHKLRKVVQVLKKMFVQGADGTSFPCSKAVSQSS